MPDEYESMMNAYRDCEEQRLKCLRAVSLYDQAGAGYRDIFEMHKDSSFWHGFMVGNVVTAIIIGAVTFALSLAGVI